LLTLNDFIRFPTAFKDREKLVDKIRLLSIIPKKTEYGIEVKSRTDKYEQIIEIYDNKINLKSSVKVTCNCESFKFEFANAVFKAGSLINAIAFLRSIIKRPKEKNEFNIPSGCKHIIALARACLKIKI